MTKRIRQYIGILAALYYITIALLLLLPEWAARLIFGGLLLADALVFWKRILPVYRQSFSNDPEQAA